MSDFFYLSSTFWKDQSFFHSSSRSLDKELKLYELVDLDGSGEDDMDIEGACWSTYSHYYIDFHVISS